MTSKIENPGHSGFSHYSKGKVFAVAPMIDWIEIEKMMIDWIEIEKIL